MIAVIDYGMGNLRSVQKAFERIGCDARVIDHPRGLDGAHGIVLPGVGAFAKAMENLDRQGFVQPLLDAIADGRPFLGICLGLQLLLEESEERFGEAAALPQGLGLIRGRVRRFPAGLKVPQIGWNQVRVNGSEGGPSPSRLYEGVRDGDYVYFLHSYYADPVEPGVVAARTEYGITFASGLEQGNVMAVQFHPEKSSRVGLRILQNFANLV